jgi:hypothetical protein
MNKNDIINLLSPCGIYCAECPNHCEVKSCAGCRSDSRHEKCDIYECCSAVGGKNFCFECDSFPCERLREFTCFHPGKNFAHFRHSAVTNLGRKRSDRKHGQRKSAKKPCQRNTKYTARPPMEILTCPAARAKMTDTAII